MDIDDAGADDGEEAAVRHPGQPVRRIIVGFGEAVSAPEVCFSLAEAGIEIHAFTRDVKRCSLRHLPFIRLHRLPAPEDDGNVSVSALRELIGAVKADAVMPLEDFTLAMVQDLYLAGTVEEDFIAGPDRSGAALALDKSLQFTAARSAGLYVPETRMLDECLGPGDWNRFPAIVKPAQAVSRQSGQTSRWVKGATHTVCSRQDLADVAQALRNELPDVPYLVQPLIRGTGEGVFGFVHDGAVVGWSAHRRLRMMNPQGSGSSACISTLPEDGLCTVIEAMLRENRWRGMFMVELLRDREGTAWFMELNGRPWGSMALARRCGLNYPAWALRAMSCTSGRPQFPAPVAGKVARHLGRDIIHAVSVLRGPKDAVYSEGWPNRWSMLGSVARLGSLDEFYNYNRAYPAFFLRESADVLLGKLRKRR